MVRNYLKIAWRNFKRDKIFSIVNIAGLAVGVACFLTLFLFIQDELSFDNYNPERENIYRVFVNSRIGSEQENNSKTSGSLGPTLLDNFSEVRTFMRMSYFGAKTFMVKGEMYRSGHIFGADSTFFEIFPLTFIQGDAATALTQPNSIVLTETLAKALFKNENAFGKTLPTQEGITYLVTGVVRDFPPNSHFSCRALESLSTYELNENWLDLWYSTYIVMAPDTDIPVFEEKLKDVVVSYVGPEAEKKLGVSIQQFLQSGNQYAFKLQPFSSIYLHSFRNYRIDPNTEWSNVKMGDVAHTYMFIAISAFILLLAIINFTNLATAKSERRAREVGVRKTFGSARAALMMQFVGEAIVLTTAATVLGLVFLSVLLPFFNDLVERQLHFYIVNDSLTIPILLAFIIIVGSIAGIYPAFYLSSFSPNVVLKSIHRIDNGKGMLRSGLVIIQFSIAIALVIGTIVIQNQLTFILNKDLGFRKDHLIQMNIGGALAGHLETFKEQLQRNPDILSVTNSSRMFSSGIPGTGFLYNKRSGTDPFLCQFLDVDYDFRTTFGFAMASGRFFSMDFPSDSTAVVINEAAAGAMTNEDPVGKDLISLDAREEGKAYRIIGVMKDINYESLHREVRPLVLHISAPRQISNILTVRISSSGIPATLAFIEKEWKKIAREDQVFSYSFLDETLSNLYKSDQKTRVVISIFSGLAVFIACIGLFGLAAFITEQRTKEIGIRKVLGASVPRIVLSLSKEFALWVGLANLIAWPVAYFAMQRWLENFAFREGLNAKPFLIASVVTLIIAITTVAIHTIRAARNNPVKSLKYE